MHQGHTHILAEGEDDAPTVKTYLAALMAYHDWPVFDTLKLFSAGIAKLWLAGFESLKQEWFLAQRKRLAAGRLLS